MNKYIMPLVVTALVIAGVVVADEINVVTNDTVNETNTTSDETTAPSTQTINTPKEDTYQSTTDGKPLPVEDQAEPTEPYVTYQSPTKPNDNSSCDKLPN